MVAHNFLLPSINNPSQLLESAICFSLLSSGWERYVTEGPEWDVREKRDQMALSIFSYGPDLCFCKPHPLLTCASVDPLQEKKQLSPPEINYGLENLSQTDVSWMCWIANMNACSYFKTSKENQFKSGFM